MQTVGKIVVITGAGSGLGRATAEALAAAGAKVAIFDVNEAKGEEVAQAIGGLFCKVDITSEDSVVAGFAKARAAHGQERVLVHCAMTSRRGKTLAFQKEEGKLKRLPTADYEYGVQGILVASYRLASLSRRLIPQLALGSMIFGGVLERYPNLAIIVSELGIDWLPDFLAFIDDGGYRRPELWLSMGWDWVRNGARRAPRTVGRLVRHPVGFSSPPR